MRLSEFRIPKTLAKAVRRSKHYCTIDENFDDVIQRCSEAPRTGQQGTWITPEMLKAYRKFHKLGYAHSIEVWEPVDPTKGSRSKSSLIGGLYGVEIDGIFAGESMFHTKPYASKFGLIFLVDHLRKQEIEWIDIQMLTPHMKALGAEPIRRQDFLSLLVRTRSQNLARNLKLHWGRSST